MAGARNRLTVVDIDARGAKGERLLADIQNEIGPSGFIVRTGGGGFHAYYKHAGERRKIRLDPQRPIDLLGGGQVVLPPSLGSESRYEIIHGRLDDLTALTPIQMPLASGSEPEPAAQLDKHGMRANSGRNNALFRALCEEARRLPPHLDPFVARARELNQFGVPMTDSEVIKTAKSVFRYVETGQLRTGEHGAWFTKDQVQALTPDPYLFTLLAWLKAANGPDAEFWIANGLAEKHLGWSEKQLRPVRRRAIEGGWIQMIVAPAKGRNAVYRWGPAIFGVPKRSPYPQ